MPDLPADKAAELAGTLPWLPTGRPIADEARDRPAPRRRPRARHPRVPLLARRLGGQARRLPHLNQHGTLGILSADHTGLTAPREANEVTQRALAAERLRTGRLLARIRLAGITVAFAVNCCSRSASRRPPSIRAACGSSPFTPAA